MRNFCQRCVTCSIRCLRAIGAVGVSTFCLVRLGFHSTLAFCRNCARRKCTISCYYCPGRSAALARWGGTNDSARRAVQGDVIRLRRGDQIPADATVLLGAAEVNESLLTGESEPIPKKVSDTLLSGSYLTEGELTAKLTEVGAQSFAGKLQLAARRMRRPRSELMASLNRVIRVVSVLIIPIGVALYLRQTIGLGMDTPTAVTKTVAAPLGMIPEGLILLTSARCGGGCPAWPARRAVNERMH